MRKLLGTFATVALLSLSAQVFAGADVGEKIYKQAFGRGCGACHDIATNPQLTANIKAGKLDKAKFATTIKEGKNGMPKAGAAIMAVGAVKSAGLTEDQAIDAIYDYLAK
ncbi:MAG: cytochrome c [Methylococcaceae bacterium]|nr:cytochrome c [Methylococcaceae bacterium]